MKIHLHFAKNLIILLCLTFSLSSEGQSFSLEYPKEPVPEKKEKHTVTIVIRSIDKSAADKIKVKIFDVGSASEGKDFKKKKDVSELTLDESNGFMEKFEIDILPDGDEKEGEEYFEVHFLFTNSRSKKMEDSVAIIKIAANKKPENDEAEEDNAKTRKFIGIKDFTGRKDKTNTNKIEFIQYTDFSGFSQDRPNGLLQQEFRLKWGVNKYQYSTKGQKSNLKVQLLRSVLFPEILLNRLDKTKQEVNYAYQEFLPKTGTKQFVGTPLLSTMDIFRYSNLQIGGRIILLALEKNNFRLQLEAGAKLLRNRLFLDTLRSGPDSGKVADDLRPVHSFVTTLDLYGKTLLSKKDDIRLEFNAGIMWINLKDSYYEQFDAAVKDAYDRATVLLPVNKAGVNRGSRPICYANIRLNKDWGENQTNAAFFRVNYYYQTGTWQKNLRGGDATLPPVFVDAKFHNHYLQLQLGVALDVKKLFNLKGSAGEEKGEKITDSPISN